MSSLQLILDVADKYAKQTGTNLKENQFLDKVKGCDSPDAVLLLLQENMKAFNDYRAKDRRFIDCLDPVVRFAHAFSAILGEAVGLVIREQSFRCPLSFTLFHKVPFQPAKLIFVGIYILFAVRVSLLHSPSPSHIRGISGG